MAIITRDTREGHQFSGKPKRITEERVYAFSGGFPTGRGWPQKNIHTDVEFAKRCGYLTDAEAAELDENYDRIIGQLVRMISKPEQWAIRS